MPETVQPVLCLQGAPDGPLVRCASQSGWRLAPAQPALDAEDALAVAALLVDDPADIPALDLRRTYPHALILAPEPGEGVDLLVPLTESVDQLQTLLQHAADHWRRNRKVLALVREVGLRRQRMHQLSEIGIALSSRMEFSGLLESILTEARRIAHCDAGSLYLIDSDDQGEEALVFKLAQNDSIDVPFVEARLPLTQQSLAGYVALSGDELNLEDAYQLPDGAPYVFNRSFDDRMGYRTRSMFILPMRDHRDRVVGVLQFINRKHPITGAIEPFGSETTELLRAIASQAAVSIQKNSLIRDMNQLFESFVQASVKTIEQRDPSTSGHSFRVAEKTVALLEALPRSGLSRFRDLTLTPEHIREVRYAALLHDFGKIGVREEVLVKANKLSDDRLELIHYRIELQKERLRRRAVEQELELLHHGHAEVSVTRRRIHRELARELTRLDDFYEWVVRANRPNILEAGDYEHLQTIRQYPYLELDGTRNGLINDHDLLALSVRRGSLTPEERQAIESHVVHTRDFLETLPWPPELAQVPRIAGAHHEKLDGSGYPEGLTGEHIPLPSRVMTVCDIYDALTAMDRPYKSAMSDDQALRILHEEARAGLIDRELVDIFVNAGINQIGGVQRVRIAV